MSTTLEYERTAVESAGRLTVYSVLAVGLMFPSPDRLHLLRDTLLPAFALIDIGDGLTEAARDLAAWLPADVDPLRHPFMKLFPPIASQDAPGYETGYRGDGIFQQTAIMADIAGFYRAHGLRAGGAERERPDHITVELEFMAVVARKEMLALQARDRDKAAICRQTGARFLSEHLACWAPAFGRRVAATSLSPWYAALGELTARWVEFDCVVQDVKPLESVQGPRPLEPPDDGSCGPCPMPVAGGVQ